MPGDGLSFDTGFALETAAAAPALDPQKLYDVLVLGAGPAGITAAIYLLRKGLAVAVIGESLGGQVAWTAAIANYLGYRLVDGAELVARFREQIAEHAPDLGLGLEATELSRGDGVFTVAAGGGRYRGRAVVIATGKRPRTLGVPGEQRLLGHGVAFCATCDAPLYRGKEVAVIGGGNSGLAAAIELAPGSPKVTLIEAGGRLSGDRVLAETVAGLSNVEVLLGTTAVEVTGGEQVEGLRVREGSGGAEREIPLAGVFVEVGLEPNSAPFRGFVPVNERGEIVVDCAGRTPVPGVFAAGDVTIVPWKQIIVAAGEGAKAGLSAHDWLLRGAGARPDGKGG